MRELADSVVQTAGSCGKRKSNCFMRVLNLLYRRDTAAPIYALTFASAAGVALVFTRVLWTHNLRYGFLVWNLLLAWLPLVFALLARDLDQRGERRNWRFVSLTAAWLLFFPNAPYIFTDVIHLLYSFSQHFWVDLSLIHLFALTGLVLGFVSLYFMQAVVSRMLGGVVGWLFVAGVAGLASFGAFLGRFLRFNSWDVLAKPLALYHGIGSSLTQPGMHPNALAFIALFATFLFIAYVMLYALTHLPKPVPSERAGKTPPIVSA